MNNMHKEPVITPVCAAGDIGSNKIRLTFFGIDANEKLVKCQTPDHITAMTCALAEGMSPDHKVIKEENIQKAEKVLALIAETLEDYGIAPENTIAVATEAMRAVQGTEQGESIYKRLNTAFGKYSFDIISGQEEAILVGEAIMSHQLYHKHTQGQETVLGMAIGGGSLEIVKIHTATGAFEHPIALPYGMHPLKTIEDQFPGDEMAIERVLVPALTTNGIQPTHSILVMGGAWRTLSQVVCNKGSYVLTGKNIKKALTRAAYRPTSYYESHSNEKVQERAKNLPRAAATLNIITKFTAAKKIIFIDTKMDYALALRLHKKVQAKQSARQPSSPLTPAQASLA